MELPVILFNGIQFPKCERIQATIVKDKNSPQTVMQFQVDYNQEQLDELEEFIDALKNRESFAIVVSTIDMIPFEWLKKNLPMDEDHGRGSGTISIILNKD